MFAADQAGAKLLEEAVKSSNGSLGSLLNGNAPTKPEDWTSFLNEGFSYDRQE